MKPTQAPCGQFTVSERDDYTLALVCDGKERGLYVVTFSTPYYAVIHVLAESEEGAISQAFCAMGIDVCDKARMENHPTAVRLPLFLRGWSRHTF
jgi:hypothetical protein